MTRRRVAVLFGRELGLLQFGVRAHTALFVLTRQVEHAVVERVEACQRDELERVAHLRQPHLERLDVGLRSLSFQLNDGEQL